MPPPAEPDPTRALREIAQTHGLYPVEAFEFLRQGLGYTVVKLFGPKSDEGKSRNVTGPQLCDGLRDFAQARWGMLARVVLNRWNITSTLDFGRIVFILVDGGFLKVTPDDSIEDFRNVYDFATAFEAGYRIKTNA